MGAVLYVSEMFRVEAFISTTSNAEDDDDDDVVVVQFGSRRQRCFSVEAVIDDTPRTVHSTDDTPRTVHSTALHARGRH